MKKKFTLLVAALALLTMIVQPLKVVGQESYSVTYDVDAIEGMFASGSSYTSASGYWKVPASSGNSAIINIPITYQPDSDITITFLIATFGSGTNPSASNTTISAIGTETNSNWSGSGVSSYPSSSTYVNGVMTITKPDDPTTLGGLAVTMGVNTGVKIFRLKGITVEYTYTTGGGGGDLEDNDLALNPTSLELDMHTNPNTGTISYTTSSTGAITVSESDYITTSVSDNTITVTPTAVTPSAQTITVNQAADDTYAAGSATFTVTVTNSAPIVTVTYHANGGTGEDIEATPYQGSDYTVAANNFSNPGFTFTEWNTQAEGGGDAYSAGDVIENIQANIDLYAQWTENDEQWVLTNLADINENDVFVIVGNGYAMTNDKGTGSAPLTAAVTIANNVITSTVAENIQWTVSGDANVGYTFYPNGSTATWLYCNTTASSSSNNNIRVGTGDRKVFELNSNNYMVTKDDYVTRYLSIYNNAEWRGYINTSNGAVAISFYKKVTGGVTPPSISADNVSIAYDATSGSVEYSINNGVDGGTLTAATQSDWLTIGTVGETVPFTCTANQAAVERTATVILTYTYGDNQTATNSVTVTQAGNPSLIDMISSINSVGTFYRVQGTVVALNARGCVIGDGTGYINFYNGYTAPSVNVGDYVTASGNIASYGNIYQFSNYSPSTATIATAESSNYDGTPAITIIDAIPDTYSSGTHLSDYFQFNQKQWLLLRFSWRRTNQHRLSKSSTTDYYGRFGKQDGSRERLFRRN